MYAYKRDYLRMLNKYTDDSVDFQNHTFTNTSTTTNIFLISVCEKLKSIDSIYNTTIISIRTMMQKAKFL